MEYLHAACASIAIVLGAFQIARRKGDRPHRLLGRAYVGAMLLTALSSFFLTSMTGGFSFLHLLSVWTLITLAANVRYVRTGNMAGHVNAMVYLYGGLLTAGLFAADRHALDLPIPALVGMLVILWTVVVWIAEKARRTIVRQTA
ncbi:DUF2306 domain-containing protein [Minwuia sp.]|uniref:DUF2306 domain-containing protein n=1 Tax=Minwuia sp. TaxID=2493630 RepID=UPI003A95157B